MEQNIVHYLHSATLDSATVNSATPKQNSSTANGEALK